MSCYALLVYSPDIQTMNCIAASRSEALATFSKKLGYHVTDKVDEDWQTDNMMLDEWDESPHWVSPHIPVYRER